MMMMMMMMMRERLVAEFIHLKLVRALIKKNMTVNSTSPPLIKTKNLVNIGLDSWSLERVEKIYCENKTNNQTRPFFSWKRPK